MEYGLSLPVVGSAASPDEIERVAVDAERVGISSLWVNERALRPRAPFPLFGREITIPETLGVSYAPLETLAYVAARTSRIRLGTSVLLSLLHSPVVLARRLATLDQLSRGRVIAGLGIPSVPAEYAGSGLPFGARGERFAEFLHVLQTAWGPDPVRFEGRHYRVPDSDVGPKPAQPGGIPIIVGANHPASIRRAAELGVGFNPQGSTFEEIAPLLEVFRSAAVAAGRDPDSLPIVLRVSGALGEDTDGTRPLLGRPDDALAALARLETLGVRHVLWGGLVTPGNEQVGRLAELVAAARSSDAVRVASDGDGCSLPSADGSIPRAHPA